MFYCGCKIIVNVTMTNRPAPSISVVWLWLEIYIVNRRFVTMANVNDEELTSYVQVFQNCFGPKSSNNRTNTTSTTSPPPPLPPAPSSSSSSLSSHSTKTSSSMSTNTTTVSSNSSPLSSPTRRGSTRPIPSVHHYPSQPSSTFNTNRTNPSSNVPTTAPFTASATASGTTHHHQVNHHHQHPPNHPHHHHSQHHHHHPNQQPQQHHHPPNHGKWFNHCSIKHKIYAHYHSMSSSWMIRISELTSNIRIYFRPYTANKLWVCVCVCVMNSKAIADHNDSCRHSSESSSST